MINSLFNPKRYHEPLIIDGLESETLRKILNLMYVIRKTEQHLALSKKNDLIKGPVHLGVGQEAIAAGISHNLKKTDRVFGAHRSHSHLLALNPNIYKLFAEILAKETGFSKGMGGSMHLFDQSNGFYGSTPIVSGTVSLAVGAALASKMQKLKDIGVSYIGDGAMEEGVVHESLNLARVSSAPILFVIENNSYASHMHISLRQPCEITSRFGDPNFIPYKLIDGNDVIKIIRNSKELIDGIRNGNGPAILELVTFRWYGHVDWREDVDVGLNRSKEDIKNWKLRDPIKRLSDSMINSKIWSKEEEEEMCNLIDIEIKNAWEKAMNDPYPSKKSINKYVYSND